MILERDLTHINCYRRIGVASLKLLPKGGRFDTSDST